MTGNEKRTVPFQTESEILAEFEAGDAELARHLLGLRQAPSAALQYRIQAIPQPAAAQTREAAAPADQRLTRRGWGRMRRPLVVGVGVAILLAVALLALSPGFRAAAAQAVGEIRQLLGGGIATGPEGIPTFRPAPPFNVKQPDYLPEGVKLVAQRYNPGPPDSQAGPGGGIVTEKEVRPQAAGPTAQEAVEQDRGREAYVVLVYEDLDGRHVQLFQRAAQSGEALPAAEPRAVRGQPATLQRDGQTLKLTWMDKGMWIELEGTVPEAELLRIAESLRTTQTPDSVVEGGAGPSETEIPAHANIVSVMGYPPEDLPYCNPDQRVPSGIEPLLGEVKGQKRKGRVTIQIMDTELYPISENISYGTSVANVRDGVFAPALTALRDPSVSMHRLPYPALSFKLSEAKGCYELDPKELGYVVIEVWDDQVNVGYGGAGAELKERAIKALEQELRKRP